MSGGTDEISLKHKFAEQGILLRKKIFKRGSSFKIPHFFLRKKILKEGCPGLKKAHFFVSHDFNLNIITK